MSSLFVKVLRSALLCLVVLFLTGRTFVVVVVVFFQMLKEGPDQDILIESFLSLGRVDHLTMVMALHPSYLSCFLKAQHALLELDGPLPRHWRHYIAVMVSGPKVNLDGITGCSSSR